MGTAFAIPGTQESQEPTLTSTMTRGVVVRAPEDENDSLDVQLYGDSALQAPTCPAGQWMSRGGSLPQVGSTCLALFDAQGDLWVTGWTGFTTNPPDGEAGGDLGGAYPDPTVVGLQGRPVLTTEPEEGEALIWNGDSWTPEGLATTLPPSGPAGGVLAGDYPDPEFAEAMLTAANNLDDVASVAAAVKNLGLFAPGALWTWNSTLVGVNNGGATSTVASLTINNTTADSQVWFLFSLVVGNANSSNWTEMYTYITSPWGTSLGSHGYHNLAAETSDSTFTNIVDMYAIGVGSGSSGVASVVAEGPSPFGWFVQNVRFLALRVA